MSAHVQQAGVFSGRSMTFMAVVGLHAFIISALILMKIVPPIIDKGPQPLQWFDDPPEVLPPDPVPQPRVKPVETRPFEVVVPPLEIPFEVEGSADTIQVAVIEGPLQQVDPGPAVDPEVTGPPVRVFKDLQYRAVMSPEVFYPTTSVALQEQGVAIVNVCVNAAGQIDGVPTIQTTSGHKRLDQAAIRWAREALRFTPASENGVSVRACKGFRVVFDLN
ncbi:MAG: TonB family protein [Pseudomonadota bacterium]